MGSGMQLQMSWQPSLLSQKRKNGPPLGLRNLGNSCYLNSVLQCLTYTPPLANFCLRSQHSSLCDSASNCPFCVLEKRISRSLKIDLSLDAPSKIQGCLRIFAEHFRTGRQEDAHEFLRYVIDACHNSCLRLRKLRRGGCGGSVVKEIFGGALQSQVKCLSCGSESNKVDEIMDISLDVLHSNSLKDAMQKFFQPEVLDGTNKYKCENCKKLVTARKQMSILQAPNILVIQLKRFEGIFGGKIDRAIAFEEVLVLSSFMCKGSQDPQPEYNLFGIIVHSGYSQESGHYYAYIKDAVGKWYCCNDAYVTLSTLQDVLSEKVYILFFSRTDKRPASSNSNFASNGVKSHELNGNMESKNLKAAIPLKAVATKPYTESSLPKDISTIPKNDKVPSSPRVKLNILGNSGPKRVSPTPHGKIDKAQIKDTNGIVKESVHKQNVKKDMSSVVNRNGFNKSVTEMSQAFAAASENGGTLNGAISSGKPHSYVNNGTTNKVTAETVSDMSVFKRKLQDSCILFAEDSQSQAKVERLKEELEQKASSFLRSCGYYDKVYSFMHSRKRICAHETGNGPSGDDLKKKLIADAKSTFVSQIPESLKEDLVKHLQSFSQEK